MNNMDTKQEQSELVFTKPAKCKDCYRCLKSCPVKAIKIKDGQAYIIEERCIHCNICIMNCAQDAISFMTNKSQVYQLLNSGRKVVISVAPSYSAICASWERERFPSALRRMGFSFVAETAVAANIVAQKTMEIVAQNPHKTHISSICPTVVNYIEKYRPELTGNLIPIASPYIVHARWLKEKFGGDVAVVHAGACVAKKMESLRPEYSGLVDAVISFAELRQMFDEQGIYLKNCEESEFDETPVGSARLFPLVGGLSAVAEISPNFISCEIIPVSGYQDIKNSLDLVANNSGILVEPLFCYKGCINGPGMHVKNNVFERRAELIEYVQSKQTPPKEEDLLKNINLSTTFYDSKAVASPKFSEAQISEVLARTGDADPNKRPNCYSCGYPTCRDSAIAVLEGMADIDMCIPYMRRFAEDKASIIIESSPNGIVTLNEHFEITSMNTAFKRFFVVSDSLVGKPISYLIDPEPFYRLATGGKELIEETVKHDKYNIVCHQIVYRLPQENQYVGIFVNVTNNLANESKLDELRLKTLVQAKSLLEHQIQMAQGIARILGENTAKSESLLSNLIKYTQGGQNKQTEDNPTNTSWLWDTSISK